MIRSVRIVLACFTVAVAPVAAQGIGGLNGKIIDATNERPVVGAEVHLDGTRFNTVTDTLGEYRFRGIPEGLHQLSINRPGYRPERRADVEIRSGGVTRADVRLAPFAVQLTELRAVGVQDPVLDPLATGSEQRITADQLRRLPVTNLDDAIAMQAGVVGGSFRGGRPGEQAYVLDGFGIKNQLDASTNGASPLQIPPDLITSATLATNGFSARFGQAISGVVDVNTKDGGEVWHGRVAYENDRPLSGAADHGIDRMVLQADGPLGRKLRAVGILDLSGMLDADPSSAPAPTDPLDPRSTHPYPLPHSSSETWTAGAKLTMPFTDRITGRLFGLATTQQSYLFDPVYKYDPNNGPGSRTDGKLLTAHVQMLPAQTGTPFGADFRLGYFDKQFVRGSVDAPDYTFGAFTGKRLHILDEELAKRQDTISTRAALPDFGTPQFASNTPYGVPAFFMSGAGSGELSWNEFSEMRAQFDATVGLGHFVDMAFGGLYAAQKVKTFQRALAYQPVAGAIPPPTASNFSPSLSGAYVEGQARVDDLGFTAGVRMDGFSPGGADLSNATLKAHTSINPRFGVSTMINGATIVASVGKFSQAPDLQYLVDAAFDDTTRTGRFRQGNPNLGFESALQYELSARVRLATGNSVKVNVYFKKLDGLVASASVNVNADSSTFVNADIGTVTGAEFIFEQALTKNWGVKVSGVVQQATATVSNAFNLYNQTHIDPNTHDTIVASRFQFPLDYDRRLAATAVVTGQVDPASKFKMFGIYPFAGLEVSAVGHYWSGLPYTRTSLVGDTLVGEINGSRLPAQHSVDMLLRRSIRIGKINGGIYVDARNVLNTANQTSVRRNTGTPNADTLTINSMATAAYNANPNPIPYESPRYRRAADLNGDGLISGKNELYPLYQAAARDFTWPLFVYGPPRLVRIGMELRF